MIKKPHPRFAAKMGSKKTQINDIQKKHINMLNKSVISLSYRRIRKQSFRAVLCTLIYISTFVPNLNFGQDEHKRRRQVATYG